MNSVDQQLKKYLDLPYTLMLQRDEDGDFIARVKELEGCVADGQDEIEALGNLNEVKEFWLRAALKAGRDIPLPDPVVEELPSGKWLMRVPRTLHKKLAQLAEREGVSLNQFALACLAEAAGERSASHRQSEACGTLDKLSAAAQAAYHQSSIHIVTADRDEPTALEQEEAHSFLRSAVGKEHFVFPGRPEALTERLEVEPIAV